MSIAAGQLSNAVEQCAPISAFETVMAKYDAGATRQLPDRTEQIADPLVGHQPYSGQRVAAAHGPLYSARS